MPSTSRTRDLPTDSCTLSDGRQLAYTTAGSRNGLVVVAHHGTPGSRLFAGLLADVAADERIRLIVPDRPGYGRSSPPPSGWTWWDWRHDLDELLAAESIDRAGIVGFSGGGPFAVAAANSDRATCLGLVSTVRPPAANGLTRLSRIPFALRLLFRFSGARTRFVGSEAIVDQYTDRQVSDTVAAAVEADFCEALRQGARAASRETRLFADGSLERQAVTVPVRAWHGTRDENTPLSPAESLVDELDGTLVPSETDHLGTLLDSQSALFEWLRETG